MKQYGTRKVLPSSYFSLCMKGNTKSERSDWATHQAHLGKKLEYPRKRPSNSVTAVTVPRLRREQRKRLRLGAQSGPLGSAEKPSTAHAHRGPLGPAPPQPCCRTAGATRTQNPHGREPAGTHDRKPGGKHVPSLFPVPNHLPVSPLMGSIGKQKSTIKGRSQKERAGAPWTFKNAQSIIKKAGGATQEATDTLLEAK